jgi:UDP-N-acetylglucosamine 2-epimerase (non-hydrolysing)
MTGFESVVKREKPDLLLVVGDVNSTLACALVAAKEGIRIAHVEAGLRSFDRTMPEEINRIVTDSLSDLLFTTSVDANVNLIREGKREDQIFFVGNPMIDCMYGAMAKIKGRTALGSELLNEKPYAFVTLHRPSNVDDTATLSGILDAFETISEHVSIIWPLHPRTRLKLEENGMWRRLQNRKNFFIQPPVGYLDSISLMSGATFVMSDSGGVQEETTVLGVPCLTLRHNTERPVTISHGTNELVGNDPRAIVSRALQILKKSDSIPMMPALWDGNSASRIVAVIKNHLLGS